MLLSSDAFHQGDSMGPLLFELIIYKLSAEMRSEFVLF